MHAGDVGQIRILAELETDVDPLLVHRSTMRVIDGVHRLRAAESNGRTEVPVRFFEGSAEDAFVLSVQCNVRHGLPLTLSERKAAVQRIVGTHPHWSDGAIAERTGLSAKTVAKVRRQVCGEGSHCGGRLGLDGKVRPVSSVEGRRRTAALLAANPQLSLRELSRETGLSVGTVRDVRHRVADGLNPVPERLRPDERAADAPFAHPSKTPVCTEAAQPSISAAETTALVQQLTRDPALRATETGRLLLRLLLATELDSGRWQEIAEVIPAHCVPVVRAVVLKRSQEWRRMAGLIQVRSVKSA
jgi:ParB-like chromosome segregation protein Spo0J